MLSRIRLKKHEDKRLKQGHLWIYSNEIDTVKSPLKDFTAGELTIIENAQGKAMGLGYINPHSLIAVRLLSRDPTMTIDSHFFKQKLALALSTRQQLFAEPYFRWIYGEGDYLPGIIIDRFADTVVVQITTAGMENFKNEIITALQSFTDIKTIYLRNDSSIRELEQLPRYCEIAQGQLPEQLTIRENNCTFMASSTQGQKTGWFYDHRNNRLRAQCYARDKRVLDVFSYVGGWGLQTLQAGAKHATFIESSAAACELLLANAKHQHHAANVRILQQDAFAALQQLYAEKAQFELIILDPPAFIKKRKDRDNGLIAYERINFLALRLLAPQGILISASCSMHLTFDELIQSVNRAACKQAIALQLLEKGGQSQDHPIHPAIPETAYLKMGVFLKI